MSSVANTPKPHLNVEDILELLKSGDENIKLESHENIILLIGNTGAGKTTFAHYIAGNNDDLVSEEVGTDTGDFIIVDKNNKISYNSTTVSKTVYPDLFVDSSSKSAFYDCPGFGDTRSAKYDIASTYFIKKVIDSARRVKIVLVVNHSSVRKGVDRSDFKQLLRHVTELIVNTENFMCSIALIVTKVDNIYIKKNRTQVLVSDENLIKNIGEFLISVKEDFKSHGNNSQLYSDRASKLIDSLLYIDLNDGYKKIGIFRRPDESGPLSNIPSFQKSKKILQNIIHNNLQFALKTETDFGFTISAESKLYIKDLVREINSKIFHEVAKILKHIEEYFFIEESKFQNVYYLFNYFKSGVNLLSKYDASANRTVTTFTEELAADVKQFHISIPEESNKNIINYNQNLIFLKTISNETLEEPIQWLESIRNTLTVFNASQKWYNFLINLSNRLSEYKLQRNINNYNDSVVMIQYPIKETKEMKISSLNLKPFIDQLVEGNELNHINRIYKEIQGDEINITKIEALKKVLNFNFNHKVESKYEELDKLVISGRYVILRDVYTEFKHCQQGLKQIEIFASEKVFIDTDMIEVGKKLHLTIISPKWEIIGERKICLDGLSGLDRGKAPSGSNILENGKTGDPGLPGGAAGNFLGIAGQVSGEELTVTAIGGRGGRGEDGGDGAPGRQGQDAPKVKEKKVTRAIYDEWSPEEDWPSDGFNWDKESEHYVLLVRDRFKVFGKPGINGGNGGDGGIGGVGGYGGTISITDFSGNRKIKAVSNNGEEGYSGRGGAGGLGAKNGDNRKIHCRYERYIFVSVTDCSNHEVEANGFSNSGNPGINGKNCVNRLHPIDRSFLNPLKSIKKFNKFINETINWSIGDPSIEEFYNKINNLNLTNIQETSSTGEKPLASALQSLNHHIRRRGIEIRTDYSTNGIKNSQKPPLITTIVSQAAGLKDTLTKWLRNNIDNAYENADFKKYNSLHNLQNSDKNLNTPHNDEYFPRKQMENTANLTNETNIKNELNSQVSVISQELQSNLMLWDFLIRNYYKQNYKNYYKNINVRKNDFSHDLAYSYYSPNNL